MSKLKRCVVCGREYHESNGYGYCFSCEEGMDPDTRECHLPVGTKKTKRRKRGC